MRSAKGSGSRGMEKRVRSGDVSGEWRGVCREYELDKMEMREEESGEELRSGKEAEEWRGG